MSRILYVIDRPNSYGSEQHLFDVVSFQHRSHAVRVLAFRNGPLHGLDCCNKERVRAVISEFCRRPGKTMIYVTHYERELPDCINRRMELPRRG